jgi:hypothetical protein
MYVNKFSTRIVNRCRSALSILFITTFFLMALGLMSWPFSDVEAQTLCYCHNICAGGLSTQCTSQSGQQNGHQKSVDCHDCLEAVGASCDESHPDYDSCFERPDPACQNSLEDTFGKCNGCGNGRVENIPGCCNPSVETCTDPDMICETCDDGNNENGDGCDENCQRECGNCDDGDPCTDDSCEAATGLCVHAPTSGPDCDDNSVCTDSDVCVDGACVGDPIDCDDGDECTTDTCDSVLGCQITPTICTDGDVCTTDNCDPATGCEFPTISCDDEDSCTVDTCDPVTGCQNDPDDCNDIIDCTTDSCDPGQGCLHVPDDAACDDSDICTDDSCDVALGCIYTDNGYSRPCYTGPDGTEDVGLCHGGTETCFEGEFGACEGEVTPTTEICDGEDNDCNGFVDDGADTDGDGTVDICDNCPDDPNKTEPGECGCGVSDVDSDQDGTADCNDGCPEDPNKTEPGECGCGVADTDSDGDGIADCVDNCLQLANGDQTDSDGDGVGDACEPEEPDVQQEEPQEEPDDEPQESGGEPQNAGARPTVGGDGLSFRGCSLIR